MPGLRLLLHHVQGRGAHANSEAASPLCGTIIDLVQLGEHFYLNTHILWLISLLSFWVLEMQMKTGFPPSLESYYSF